MVTDLTRTITLQSLVKELSELVEEAQRTGESKYPKTNMILEENGTLILTVYIKDDGELTHVHDKAKEIFGGIADEINLYFDSQEITGKKHWIDLILEDILKKED